MPNTLAHLGVQGLLTQSWLRNLSPKWVFLGCIIPDIPWILNRMVLSATSSIDPYALRLYVMAQASLACSLILCAALAALSRSTRVTFAVLASNALLHLLLDASQIKWANGVHLLAPFSWHTWNLGWFWPESLPTVLLTALGLGYGLWALIHAARLPTRLWVPPPRRLVTALSLLCAYLLVPALLAPGAEAADAHFVRTLREREARAGRQVALDRAWYQKDEGGGRIILGRNDPVVVVGEMPARSARVSLRGRFLDSGTLQVEEIHVHRGWPRDLASYAGLSLVVAVWVLALGAAGWVGRRPRPPA